jgi:hypothetical protein
MSVDHALQHCHEISSPNTYCYAEYSFQITLEWKVAQMFTK